MIRQPARFAPRGALQRRATFRPGPCLAQISWVALGLALGGCGVRVPEGWDAPAARAFQAEHRRALGGPTSPLAAVGSDYLGPGQSRTLGHRGGEVVTDGGEDPITLQVDTAFRCAAGCAGMEGVDPIEAAVSMPWGALQMVLSPQPTQAGAGGRVLVFDASASGLEHASGVAFAPIDAALIIAARFEESRPPEAVSLATTRGLQKPFESVGVLSFAVDGVAATLRGYRMAGVHTGPLLVPFTDRTNGDSTYPVGRYVEVEVDGDAAVIDFNRATNPWCAYSPHFNCPVPPKDNALAFAVPAGELAFGHGDADPAS